MLSDKREPKYLPPECRCCYWGSRGPWGDRITKLILTCQPHMCYGHGDGDDPGHKGRNRSDSVDGDGNVGGWCC